MNKFSLSRSEKFLISALSIFQFTHILDFMILMPLGPTLIQTFGISNQQFSYLVSSYTFSAGISALIASTFIDKFSRKKSLLFVYGAFLIGTLFCGLARSYDILLFSRIITGAFGGLINALIFAIVGDTFDYQKRGSATGIIMAGFSAASVAGVPLSLLIAHKMGWYMPFVILFGLGIFVLLYAYYTIPNTRPAPKAHTYSELFTEKNHYYAFLLVICMMFAGFSLIPYISNYLVFNTVLTENELPLIYLTGGGATLITARIIGYIADKFGKKLTYYIIASLSIIPIFLISHLENTSLILILVTTTIFFILVSGRFVPAMALITSGVKPHMRGGFMTLNAAVQQFASAIATLTGGLLIVQTGNHIDGYNHVSYLSLVFTLLSLFFVFKIKVMDGKEPVV